MDKLSIEELLLILSDKESDEARAELAFVFLYKKFSVLLLRAVMGHLRSKGIFNRDVAENAVSNTFVEVYNNPLSFKFDPKINKSEENAFKSWIFVIARNECSDLLRTVIKSASNVILTDTGELNETSVELEVEQEVLSNNRKLIDSALESLSERERHILMTCFDYHEDDKYTPSEVIDSLCEIWGTTRPNVRQIRKRALDKVKAYINSPIIKKNLRHELK